MSFHLSVGDNMRHFQKWHTKQHPNTSWEKCPFEPCDHMDPEFRRCWR